MIALVRQADCRVPTRVSFSAHAVERYVERARPGVDHPCAEAELVGLAGFGVVLAGAPLWATSGSPFPHLVIADITFPLVPDRFDPEVLVATTCLVRGMRPTGWRGRRASRVRRRVNNSRLGSNEAA